MPNPALQSSQVLYARLLTYLRPYWKAFALAVMGMVCTAATEPVFPAIMKYLLDKGFKAEDGQMRWLIPLGIVMLFVVRGVLSFCTSYLMTWVSARLITDIRREMFNKLLQLPTQTFHELSAGKLISKIVVDSSNLNDASTTVLVTAVRESLTALALIGYLIYLDWKLTLVTLVLGPTVGLIVNGFGKRMRAASRATLESNRLIFHSIEESAAANKVIKIYGGQAQQIQRFSEDTDRLRRAMMREAVPASAITPITHIAASVMIALLVYLALNQTTGQASASAGGFVSFITAVLMLISPIKQLTTISPTLQRGLAGCESVFNFLDTPGEHDSGDMELPRAKGEIEFDHVSFSYPGAEKTALNGISFLAKAGQKIAMVGASGGGKTTISALIPRFYHPTAGQVRIDGIDISRLTLVSLRRNIALVSQDIVLFNDSVLANIAFGSRAACSRDDVIAAAKAANAWDFIQQLPQGLDSTIGEDGAKLSGGQRQRIAIARALLKDAPILILDEATSALDTESERQVQAALAVLMKDRTTLVIAHRLSTIENSDCILVLDQGRIVESGSHAELITAGGYYANLNRIQT
jgi:subfamily B ATP-binding cassette protein MsbA